MSSVQQSPLQSLQDRLLGIVAAAGTLAGVGMGQTAGFNAASTIDLDAMESTARDFGQSNQNLFSRFLGWQEEVEKTMGQERRQPEDYRQATSPVQAFLSERFGAKPGESNPLDRESALTERMGRMDITIRSAFDALRKLTPESSQALDADGKDLTTRLARNFNDMFLSGTEVSSFMRSMSESNNPAQLGMQHLMRQIAERSSAYFTSPEILVKFAGKVTGLENMANKVNDVIELDEKVEAVSTAKEFVGRVARRPGGM